MTSFSDLGLAAPILRALEAENYDTPTPVQEAVIPAMLEGRDVVAVAQTGTGKTAGFTLPLLHQIAADPFDANKKTARILILTPTRELAAQVENSVKTYAKFMAVSTTLIVGGARLMPQVRSLNFGTDVAVATPGRLEDLMRSGAIKLDGTTAIVLDEADQMMDMGFIPAIRRIMAALPRERQVVLFSATMPKQIRALADDFLSDPAEVAIAPKQRTASTIHQTYRTVERFKKRDTLTELLKEGFEGQVIVFTRTKRGADKVTDHLEEAGLSARSLHGDKHQTQRERILKAFRSGRTKILVATDVAARGIDVDDVSLVINYELPINAEAYVHRIGRTGRAGREGRAIAFVDRDERSLLGAIERLAGTIEREGEDLFSDDPVKPYERKRGRGAGPARGGERGPRAGDRGMHPRKAKPHRKGPSRPREGAADRRPQSRDRDYNPVERDFESADRPPRSARRDRENGSRDWQDRPQRSDRGDHKGQKRQGRDWQDRSDRSDRRGPPQRGPWQDRSDRPERSDRSDRRDRAERPDYSDRRERSDRRDRPDYSDRPRRSENHQERRGSGDRPFHTKGRDDRSDRRGGQSAGRDHRGDSQRGGFERQSGREDRGPRADRFDGRGRSSDNRGDRPRKRDFDGDRSGSRRDEKHSFDRDRDNQRGPRDNRGGDRPFRANGRDKDQGRGVKSGPKAGSRGTGAGDRPYGKRRDAEADGNRKPREDRGNGGARPPRSKPEQSQPRERRPGPNATRAPSFKKPTRDY